MYAGFSKAKLTHQAIAVQTLFLGACILLIVFAINSARTNLEELGIGSGFAFLDRATGWSYSFALIESSVDDPYRWTLFIGFLNTLFVGFVSIVLATVLGFAVGSGRDSSNFALKASSTTFIQIFRNIPLILQVVFWYAALIHMPGPRQAISVFDAMYISNRGVMMPWLNLPVVVVIAILAVLVISWVAIRRRSEFSFFMRVLFCGAVAMVSVFAAHSFINDENTALLSIPHLAGLRFRGGLQIPVELVAMIISIVLYGAAYIGEVVRGGLQGVPKGLVEAGKALGLPGRVIWFKIKLPVALATIIPPLGNQWIFLMKATTIGVAIGFSDLFMIVSTSITQSGQTLELIGILMAAFLLTNYCIAQFVNVLNRRFQLPGR